MVPKPLYEVLPFTYIAVAFAIIVWLYSGASVGSVSSIVLLLVALVFGITGLATLAMRDSFRRQAR